MNDRLRGTRTKKYVGFVTGAAVVVGAAVTVALAQPWADGPVQSTPAPPVRYVGVHQPDAPNSYYEVQQFAQAIGTQPNLVSYYSRWRESFQVSFATLAKDHGALPLVQIDPQGVSLAAIAAGRDDGYLRSYAAAVKAFGRPIVMSFGHEMNGTWSPWGYKHTPPGVFVSAWRHIVTEFRAMGATNVIWMWTVNVIDQDVPVPIPSPGPWWPGAGYVNWVGIDGYYVDSSTGFASLFGPTITAVRGLTEDPILIAETGADPQAGQPAKINDLFDGVRTYGLLGLLWFDENTEGRAWRITSRQAFSAFGRDAKSLLNSQQR
jgi:hypothetical protein